MTIYDSYVNMLRTTTEAMSAVLGGIHSLTVQPFDAHYQKPSVFSERIARNQQLIIREEAYLSKVVDPAAGSYYIEKLTASIIEHAWNLFLKVDELGGYSKSFIQGFIQNEINTVAQKRVASIANRRDTVLGTNQYPNFGEVVDTNVVKPEHINTQKTETTEGAIAEPLRPFRVAQTLEELRYKTDSSGKRPKAFMLTLGSLGMRRARAQFSCNFFACGGFEVIDNIGFKTVNEGVHAALEAKAEIVVICSSDEDYATLAPEAFEMLNGKAIFVVAGEPACKPELEAKGVKHFISVKSNLLETLRYYQQLLKIN
jgi:methylmalonyl-CoA mutase